MVPERDVHQPAQRAVENVGHAHRQRRRPAGAGDNGLLAHLISDMRQRFRGNRKAPTAHHLRRRRHHIGGSRRRQHRHRAVHREVDARVNDTGGDQRHNRHEGFHQHAAVADKAGLIFIRQHLRRGTGGNQGVEARHRAASDSDKQEREQGAFPQRAGAINVLGHCRHFQVRVEDNDPQRQADDNADFQESSQIVTRRQNQPYRQQGGDKRVANQGKGDGGVFKGQRRAPVGVVSNNAAEPDGGHQQHDTDNRHFTHAARAQEAHVDPHEQRDRHRRADGKDAPRALRQRFHYDQRQYREDDDHNQEAAKQGDRARNRPHLLLDHLAQRGVVTPR
ncbi:hypothetical protein SB00610_02257 [Klebsiella quasipneumoniae subsp. similipneumoniae]|nr:hypothetical protein SB00610_02257 [Klebsiella quasipneumoniae subsp. similipneumoniae]